MACFSLLGLLFVLGGLCVDASGPTARKVRHGPPRVAPLDWTCACRRQGRINAEVPESAEVAEKEVMDGSRKRRNGVHWACLVVPHGPYNHLTGATPGSSLPAPGVPQRGTWGSISSASSPGPRPGCDRFPGNSSRYPTPPDGPSGKRTVPHSMIVQCLAVPVPSVRRPPAAVVRSTPAAVGSTPVGSMPADRSAARRRSAAGRRKTRRGTHQPTKRQPACRRPRSPTRRMRQRQAKQVAPADGEQEAAWCGSWATLCALVATKRHARPLIAQRRNIVLMEHRQIHFSDARARRMAAAIANAGSSGGAPAASNGDCGNWRRAAARPRGA